MKSSELEYMPGRVTVPRDVNKWTCEYMEERINVTRVTLAEGQGLTIYFNIVDDNTFLDVVVIPRRRPHLEDFKNAKIISTNNSFYYIPGDSYSQKGFYFVGVLPNKKTLDGNRGGRVDESDDEGKNEQRQNDVLTIDYEVAYELPQCMSWTASGRKWNDSTHCKVIAHLNHKLFTNLLSLGWRVGRS